MQKTWHLYKTIDKTGEYVTSFIWSLQLILAIGMIEGFRI